ncbi:hypothetical protein E8A74_31010 [Polyangium fumosum]|uniref:Uncharacterized protein n=1 Tax=Polyangium fumosum TaxID=889272 RepID=A0A4U1J4C1_9BACT|nr:hypothetical protein E8A74_31010 [Polyangium fumosum]
MARAAGFSPDDPFEDSLTSSEVPWVEVPDVSGTAGAFEPGKDPYAAYADAVIETLSQDVQGDWFSACPSRLASLWSVPSSASMPSSSPVISRRSASRASRKGRRYVVRRARRSTSRKTSLAGSRRPACTQSSASVSRLRRAPKSSKPSGSASRPDHSRQ